MTVDSNKDLCKQKQNIAYKSCVDSFFNSKDANDIKEYWIYLLNNKRYCEAKGVEKALELIDIYQELRS